MWSDMDTFFVINRWRCSLCISSDTYTHRNKLFLSVIQRLIFFPFWFLFLSASLRFSRAIARTRTHTSHSWMHAECAKHKTGKKNYIVKRQLSTTRNKFANNKHNYRSRVSITCRQSINSFFFLLHYFHLVLFSGVLLRTHLTQPLHITYWWGRKVKCNLWIKKKRV